MSRHPLIPNESDVVKQITDWLSYNDFCWFYVPNRGRWDKGQDHKTPGAPDIMALDQNSIAVAIEVKSPKGTQSRAQKEFQDKWEAAGGRYILARSIDDLVGQE